MLCLLWVALLAGPLPSLTAAAPLPADTSRTFVPNPSLPRLTATLSTANRTVYLQRAPQSADDRGYLGTLLTYQAPSGFLASGYLNHSYAYTFLSEPFINFGEGTLGWQSTSNSATYWVVEYTRLFVYGESALVQASLRNDLSASVTHFFDLATASASADWFVGGTNDFVLTFDLSHPFQLPVLAHDTLTLEPTIEFGAGSQHFYANSLGKTSTVKVRKRTTTTVFDVPASPGFAALGYTFSLPVTYRTGRFSFAATPSYLVPLHVPTGGDDRSFFYGTLAVSRTFW
ncbi:hypothetical protein HHL22_01565 [Hymenobacter sp. RP-2-7]|uniref:Uncharacterized protein n=1 Tax=Hymenobacter polaris TaxID=2682546 RepID=A0A7Y0FKN1_9BACT|nr:hypothetical protein [Hymenobacter polaris]NML63883.1 hypothetical protein [Hymenobacter polaris]